MASHPSTEKLLPASGSTFEKGRISENLFTRHLLEENFEVVKQNWRTPYGEVDLVAKKENILWIFEVKSQKERFLKSRNPLTSNQRARLERAAQWIWLQERKNFESFRCRLVIVTERGIKWLTLPLLYDRA
jgi:putative endonuclease